MLRVLGRREADGYHELETIFQTVTLHDELKFSELPDGNIELVCDAPGVPADESNLVYRAALTLHSYFNSHKGARIELVKRIPTGGGLGGGSSNAAIALMGLAHLWKLETDPNELIQLGAKLGADVPFFFRGGTSLGRGTGTEITPLEDVSERYLLIVTPNETVSTAEAYRALRSPFLTKREPVVILPSSRAGSLQWLPEDVLHNDFETVIFNLHPPIELAKRELLRHGARGALMSGSGASVFGIFESEAAQERAHEGLKKKRDWQVFACATLDRAAYSEALGACKRFLQV